MPDLSPHGRHAANRLARETSPYLLQHAHNPVDWYPWGEEALGRARREERPILLSIGYAACHWCHVMERESFESEATARVMNEHFVCIKVDREERPDLDAIYMQAVQAMTGHGGWPMTVFLTPDGAPFYGGTYYPPEDRQGMPSFTRVLLAVAEAWRERRDQVGTSAARMRELYAGTARRAEAQGALDARLLERAARTLEGMYDERDAGFGRAPKFPPTMALDFLLRRWARSGEAKSLAMAHTTFVTMARGGIYDQVGGGFARYAVDARWLVPHFEKMLYDNALLVRLGAQLWQATKDPEVRRVTEETLEWLEREMTSPEGGFYSSLDADSGGHEGLFYLWTAEELDALLGDDAPVLRAYWAVSPEGNFEGRSILHVPDPPTVVAQRLGTTVAALHDAVARARRTLYDVRGRRVWPGRDDKILASWNALMLRGVAEAARAFDDERWRALARRSGDFLWRTLVRDEGGAARVLRVHKDGVTRIEGFLEDHAAAGLAALAMYELTFDATWLDRARALADAVVARFWSEEHAAFFDTAHDA
ncbi:MAG TPA: thioredoxin domain-containing protein, partial [Gemmatimonadaceae bacterium]|nr:thioredoxin domain-containing protein [Gemmatimonadaceae bacterium]